MAIILELPEKKSRPSGPVSHDAKASEWKVETVTDYEALLWLQPAWDRLAEGLDASLPFLSHAWTRTWWESFGAGKELHVLLVKQGEELKAIVPLMLSWEKIHGMRVRRLGFLYNYHTPRCDFLTARDAKEACRPIWKYLKENMTLWDFLDFCQMPADSESLQAIRVLAYDDGFCPEIRESRPSPYVRIGAWDDYHGGLSRKHRGNLKSSHNRLAGLGRVRFEEISAEGEIGQALHDGFQLEAASWKGKNGTAITSDEATRRFYMGFAARAARRGWLRLHFLASNQRRIAFDYSIRYGNKQYGLKLGYDPAYSAYSPGHLLCLYTLKEAFERGLSEFDFAGVDDKWKLRWTRLSRPHSWLYVFSKSLRGRMLHQIKFRILSCLRGRCRRPAAPAGT
ncbi:MAG: GNAT family N-acetyltransferase [Candidatus Tectomicrobia bacterium]|uniref:GNAT family N-acetyltransferase n=1 Tax=Tectimicrobiota bacterium TaxID=2528274 RepID=A0A932I177_UNCTE|nr:GNAT family N-acetyltransferase [Candidatus Tectomicrobia bacterium]